VFINNAKIVCIICCEIKIQVILIGNKISLQFVKAIVMLVTPRMRHAKEENAQTAKMVSGFFGVICNNPYGMECKYVLYNRDGGSCTCRRCYCRSSGIQACSANCDDNTC